MSVRGCLLLAVVVALPASGVQAQQNPTGSPLVDSIVSGTVRDAQTGAPVTDAVVTAQVDGQRSRDLTNDHGVYHLTVPIGEPLRVRVERFGYVTLTLEGVELQPGVPVDFALEPEPVRLSALTVRGRRTSPALAELVEPGLVAPRTFRGAAETTLERGRVEAFAPVLQVLQAESGSGGGSSPPSGPGVGALAVRGYLSRHGATFVDGAPTMTAGPVSFLADPFVSRRTSVRVWDGGAPARVTGGLEYVAELDHPLPPVRRGLQWWGSMDLARLSADLALGGRRLNAEVSGYTTDPWTSWLLGERGHRSRMITMRGSSAPWRVGRLTFAGSTLAESLPAGGPVPKPSAEVGEGTGSLRWEGSMAEGFLAAWVAMSHSRASLPNGDRFTPGPGFVLNEDRSYAGIEYQRTLGRSTALDAGADRLGYHWWGSASSTADVLGVWVEADRALGGGIGVRAGLRLDCGPGVDALEPAPRMQVDWLASSRLRVSLSRGVYHQVVLGPARPEATGGERPILTTGVHHRGTVRAEVGPVEVRFDGYLKRLTDLPGVEGTLNVRGLGLGVDAPVGGGGRISAAATAERRRDGASSSWAPMLRLNLRRTIPGRVFLKVRLGGSRSAGALAFGNASLDTARVIVGGSGSDAGPSLRAWSVVSDAELSRTIHRTAQGQSLSVYVQLLNVLGREYRPLFLEYADVGDPRVPRALVIGVRVGAPAGPIR